jgi:hypothetical protein
MILFWRGWGFSVALLFVFWIFALIFFVALADPYQLDMRKAGLEVQWLFAAMFALHAASVYAVVWYRRTHPRTYVDPASLATVVVPHADDFMFIRVRFWPWILLAVAAIFAGASLFGYPLFDR